MRWNQQLRQARDYHSLALFVNQRHITWKARRCIIDGTSRQRSPAYCHIRRDMMNASSSTEQQLNPFPWYQTMRERAPVWHSAEQGRWHVFRFEDVQRVLS